jgi:hypothetical protein
MSIAQPKGCSSLRQLKLQQDLRLNSLMTFRAKLLLQEKVMMEEYKDAFKVKFSEVSSCQNVERKGTKSIKLLSQAAADHYVDLLKSFNNVKPGD